MAVSSLLAIAADWAYHRLTGSQLIRWELYSNLTMPWEATITYIPTKTVKISDDIVNQSTATSSAWLNEELHSTFHSPVIALVVVALLLATMIPATSFSWKKRASIVAAYAVAKKRAVKAEAAETEATAQRLMDAMDRFTSQHERDRAEIGGLISEITSLSTAAEAATTIRETQETAHTQAIARLQQVADAEIANETLAHHVLITDLQQAAQYDIAVHNYALKEAQNATDKARWAQYVATKKSADALAIASADRVAHENAQRKAFDFDFLVQYLDMMLEQERTANESASEIAKSGQEEADAQLQDLREELQQSGQAHDAEVKSLRDGWQTILNGLHGEIQQEQNAAQDARDSAQKEADRHEVQVQKLQKELEQERTAARNARHSTQEEAKQLRAQVQGLQERLQQEQAVAQGARQSAQEEESRLRAQVQEHRDELQQAQNGGEIARLNVQAELERQSTQVQDLQQSILQFEQAAKQYNGSMEEAHQLEVHLREQIRGLENTVRQQQQYAEQEQANLVDVQRQETPEQIPQQPTQVHFDQAAPDKLEDRGVEQGGSETAGNDDDASVRAENAEQLDAETEMPQQATKKKCRHRAGKRQKKARRAAYAEAEAAAMDHLPTPTSYISENPEATTGHTYPQLGAGTRETNGFNPTALPFEPR